MIDISQRILQKWKDAGIDISRIKSNPYEVDLKGLVLLDGEFFMFRFEIELENPFKPMRKKDGNWDNYWMSLTKEAMKIECTVGDLTLRACLAKDQADGFGGYNNAKCYIQFIVRIDEDKLTEEQWEKMTKPDFIRSKCDKEGDVLGNIDAPKIKEKKKIEVPKEEIKEEEPKVRKKNKKSKKKEV